MRNLYQILGLLLVAGSHVCQIYFGGQSVTGPNNEELMRLGLSTTDIEELQEITSSITEDDLANLQSDLDNISEKELEALADLSPEQVEQFYNDRVGNTPSDHDIQRIEVEVFEETNEVHTEDTSDESKNILEHRSRRRRSPGLQINLSANIRKGVVRNQYHGYGGQTGGGYGGHGQYGYGGYGGYVTEFGGFYQHQRYH